MDPMQAWTLVAFVTVMSAALLSLELGMRRARGAQQRRIGVGPPLHRGRGNR
jgi:hypothetical protein